MNTRETVQIKYILASSSNPYVVWLSNHLMTRFRLQPKEKVWFRYGNERFLVKCEVKLDDTYGMVEIPDSLKNSHRLPPTNQYHSLLYSIEKNEIRIGPILSLFVDRHEKHQGTFGNMTQFAVELNELSRKFNIVFYVFSYEDVEPDGINGYTYVEGKWIQEPLPYPDVIYNRITNRRLERTEAYTRFFNHCHDWGIQFFNDRYLSKWEVFSLLLENDAVAAHLPKTVRISDKEALLETIYRFTVLYLKPIDGHEGRGIVRITKQLDEKLKLEASDRIEPPLPSLTDKGLIQFIDEYVPSDHYILQQGIDLIQYRGGNVDFRILCNRNEYGIWCITSSLARIGKEEHIVTNVSKGATTSSPIDVLESRFDRMKAKLILSMLYDLSIEVCEWIASNLDGLYGEFGIDFGVDGEGHPWILEVNTKPSKALLSPCPSDIRPSAKRVFAFLNYLYTASIPE
ncbi:YheC/YheD family protein [Pseudalkalibacillus sp. SCS-8]|uniref:YheC/YheD family endospore coat-associated protein n=1 Tax=Pseudalkalibacillus nanhaiensis TaxID=3115291 RepID=UPI0032DAADA7